MIREQLAQHMGFLSANALIDVFKNRLPQINDSQTQIVIYDSERSYIEQMNQYRYLVPLKKWHFEIAIPGEPASFLGEVSYDALEDKVYIYMQKLAPRY